MVVPVPALAQDGVFVDPESPTAKQYAIPLDAARRSAADPEARRRIGIMPNRSSRQEAPPLFGEGITPPGTPGRSRAGGPTGVSGPRIAGDRSSPARRPPTDAREASPRHRPSQDEEMRPVAGAATAGGTLPGALGVLAVGSAVALLLRRLAPTRAGETSRDGL